MRGVVHMAVTTVQEVHVATVVDRRVAAALAMDVHVATVGQMACRLGLADVVHVPIVPVMDVPVVDVVQVVLMDDGRVSAEPVVVVTMVVVGPMAVHDHDHTRASSADANARSTSAQGLVQLGPPRHPAARPRPGHRKGGRRDRPSHRLVE
jgi:hypothetical protein